MKFEWDDNKQALNIEKHGVSFYHAQRAFADPNHIIAEDRAHSGSEQRYYCFGKINDVIITVRFTRRGDITRIIGAGYWRKGKAIYEKKENHLY